MKKWVFIYFVLCLFTISKAQNNLVPNWSFEDITQCPHYYSIQPTIVFAYPWKNPNIGTSDLYSTCDTVTQLGIPTCGVPYNVGGYQMPHTGNNYAGFLAWGLPSGSLNNVREYIQVALIDSLKSNKKYCVSFFVNVPDSNIEYSTSRIGCYVSKGSVSNSNQFLISETPQILNPYNHFLTDNINWMPIQGLYTAKGGENYITIGNFFNDANTDTLSLFKNNSGRSYYFIDDISLFQYDSTKAYAGKDSRQCIGTKVTLGTSTQPAFGASYIWSVLSGDANSITDSSAITAVYVAPKITTTYVLQKQQCGIFTYDTVTVYIKPTYTANAGADASICIGDSATIGTAAICNWCSYNWQNVQAPYQNMPQLTVYPLANTTYMLSLKDSCFTTYSNVTVNVAYCQSPVVSVPNIFTPNADGINDTWQLTIISGQLSVINYQCTIYDRWGAKVFDSSTPLGMTNNGWDGHTTSGLAATEGTYYYVINYTDAKTNEQKSLKGFLELVR